MSSPDDAARGWLATDRVWRRYGDTVAALRGVSLTIGRGQYVSITGASGSGKSTLLHILSGLDAPTEGSRTICGVTDPNQRQRTHLARTQVGVIFQSFHLLTGLTALENVAVGMLYSGARERDRELAAADALDRVGLGHRHHHLPTQLSGGEQQRVAVARATLVRPSVLCADEPTGNLDTTAGDSILDLLDDIHAQGTTVVLVTHDSDAAARAERQLVLRDGEIIADEVH